MVRARRVARAVKEPDSDVERLVDLGLVGEPERVNRRLLDTLIEGGAIPVIAPIAFSAEGETLNVNADTFAGAIAGALGAKRFLLLTDVAGVLDRDRRLIQELSLAEARALVADGTVSGGMIPKLETCIYAIEQGVEGVVILDGRVPHALLLELLTDHGAGTLIR
jgi:acetylglutamate kinase